jgi:diguanylate cyclase (GGDEF)-like protein
LSPDPSAVDAALIAGASQLFTGRATIIPDSPPRGPSDLIAHAIQVNGAAVSATDEAGHTTVAISLGGSRPRIVVCAADHHLDEFTVDALEILCAHARIALRTASLHVEARLEAEQWAQLARIDPLTGLLNRAGILEQLDHALADQQRGRIALAFIDLDRLKEINDQFGHVAGDELLREAARRLGTAVPDATAGRLGGDEFVLLAKLPPTVAATTLIDSILTALAGEVRIGPDKRARIDVSVGIAVAEQDGREAMTSDHLLQLADARMYIDKQVRRREATAESTPALVETLS